MTNEVDHDLLIGLVRDARLRMTVARQVRGEEITLRLAEAKVRIEAEVTQEVAEAESALDEALIAAVEAGVPIRQIALRAFGHRHDGNVQAQLTKLRQDGRLGNAAQRGVAGVAPKSKMPDVLDVAGALSEMRGLADTTTDPFFERGEPVNLYDDVFVETLVLYLDPRDDYRSQIAKNMRPKSPHARATTATLYRHPNTGQVVAVESPESGETVWDHPVARWAKDHPNEVGLAFEKHGL